MRSTMRPMCALLLFGTLLALVAACVPAGVPGGGAREALSDVTAGPAADLVLEPGQWAVIALDDAPDLPGVLASDGVVATCDGAAVAAHAGLLTGTATLTVEAGARGGPWTPLASAEGPAPDVPLFVLPGGVDAVRLAILAGPDGATLPGPAPGAVRRSWLTVLRACAAVPEPAPALAAPEPLAGPAPRPPRPA